MSVEGGTARSDAGGFVRKMLVMVELEARKLKHDPTELLTRAIQPALWLLVFGVVLNEIRIIPTGDLTYLEFLTPGVLAQSVLFISIFYGISIIWERDLGIVQKFLVSPTPRSALVTGKALSAGLPTPQCSAASRAGPPARARGARITHHAPHRPGNLPRGAPAGHAPLA